MNAAATNDNVVEIRKLWTVFESADGDQVVHRDLDLTIARGEVLSLVGGSGTGKTVLLRQILGLEHPDKGSVRVLGEAPGQLSATGAANVGMLFQQGALFSAFSVLENIAFPLQRAAQAACPMRWCATWPWSSCRWWASAREQAVQDAGRTCRAA